MTTNRQVNERESMAIDLVNEAHRAGIEIGLLRLFAAQGPLKDGRHVMGKCKLYTEIAKLDNEFLYECPCNRFVDGGCERCGKPDPFATRKIGEQP